MLLNKYFFLFAALIILPSIVSASKSFASESIGFYNNGCLENSASLAKTGPGYQVMRISRERFFGHSQTVDLVVGLGRWMEQRGSGILVGDLSQRFGGPMPYGHNSHQNGLDADIWFYTHPDQRTRELNSAERENLPFVSMLDATGAVNPARFTQEQIEKLKFSSLDLRVQRIFVNPAIKQFLCSNLDPKDRAWLQKLRPWAGHDSHFHVRLFCPKADRHCTPQAAVAPGDGCGELEGRNWEKEFDSTEHEEADDLGHQNQKKTLQKISPPTACQTLFRHKK